MVVETLLALATVLCGLTAGLVFGFAVVAMPGIGQLGDREFLRAFQVMDGIIQRGQPLFGIVWLGSAVALVAGFVLGVGQVAGADRALLVGATVLYLVGVQLPTFVVNIPLNNELQALDLAAADDASARAARERFEARWNRWNSARTVIATIVTAFLVLLLIRL